METTTEVRPAEWAEYEHRRTRVRACRYDGTEESRLYIAGEINRAQPDHARSTPGGTLLIFKGPRWIEVPALHWAGIGWNGNLWEISDDVHQGCYIGPVAPDYSADPHLSAEQIRGLQVEAMGTADLGRLREIVNAVVAAAVGGAA